MAEYARLFNLHTEGLKKMEELVLEKEKQKLKKKKEKVINENVELKLELVQLIYSVLNQLQDNKHLIFK